MNQSERSSAEAGGRGDGFMLCSRAETHTIQQRNGGDRGQDGGELESHKERPGEAGARGH